MAAAPLAAAAGGVKPGEIKALAGARAIPPLMIVAYHFCEAHRFVPFATILAPPVTKGYLWVEFFFALSGFLLVHVYRHRAFAYSAFLKARLARLYPIHLATLLTMLALMLALNAAAVQWHFPSIFHSYQPPTNTFASFIANLFLVQAWGFVDGLTWNAAAWFVSIEFLLCLIFPLYRMLAKGGLGRGLVLVAAGVAWLVVLAWNSGIGLDITFRNGVFRGMADFAIGAGLALIFRTLKDRPIPERVHSIIQAGVVALIAGALYLSGPAHTRADLVTGLAVMALILPLAFDKGFLARLFQTKPFQILGGWSYGIYMGQTFWMQVVRQVDPMLPATPPARLVELLAVLLVCIVWGAALTILIERPAHRLLRPSLRA